MIEKRRNVENFYQINKTRIVKDFFLPKLEKNNFDLRTNILAKRLIFQKKPIVKHIDETINHKL